MSRDSSAQRPTGSFARSLLPAACSAFLLVAACATVRPLTLPAQSWTQRAAQLQKLQQFVLNGRLAAADGSQGFSAGVRWQQRGGEASLDLTGPLGFGTVRVRVQDAQLQIVTSNGERLEGAAAQEQLAKTLGFEPPLDSLRYWVLGVDDPRSSAERSLDDQQRLVQLQQDGWHVAYQDYTAVKQQWLPRRLTVTHEQLRLRLVIDGWQL